jgi:hypothetical protein
LAVVVRVAAISVSRTVVTVIVAASITAISVIAVRYDDAPAEQQAEYHA